MIPEEENRKGQNGDEIGLQASSIFSSWHLPTDLVNMRNCIRGPPLKWKEAVRGFGNFPGLAGLVVGFG